MEAKQPWRKRAFKFTALAASLALALSACASVRNPATGETEYSSLSAADEQRIGDQEHPKILKQFGGVYDGQGLPGYVALLGGRIAANSELPNQRWTFTVLDSPVVNAFALPGGYIYITRGLLALANDEAELAGVLGHEIGHVTGRHTAQRQTRAQVAQIGSVLASIGAAVLGVDPQTVGQVAQVAGVGYVASFSRRQELEADRLGVRYIRRAGYDPFAQADFLASLQAQSSLHSRITGRQYDPNQVDFFATHPATADRVREAAAAAGGSPVGAPRNRKSFLDQIDGMVYGDTAEQGIIRGRTFAHPKLRFRFTAPEGFKLVNSPQAVQASGPDGVKVIFDGAKHAGGGMESYISRVWAPKLAEKLRNYDLRGLERIKINGLPAATAALVFNGRNGLMEARLVAIDFGDQIYRFLALYPESIGARYDQPLRRMAYSFRKLSRSEASKVKPLRLRVVTVRRGDTINKLARRMAFDDFQVERFLVLNALDANAKLRAGDKVKIVTE